MRDAKAASPIAKRSLLTGVIAAAIISGGLAAAAVGGGANTHESHGGNVADTASSSTAAASPSAHTGHSVMSIRATSAESVEVLPCTRAHEPTNFTTYSVGPHFDGMRMTQFERQCTEAPAGAPAYVRMNAVWYSYGECEPRAGESACQPPLTVMTFPLCERDSTKAPPNPHNPLHGRRSVRGVQAELYENGYRLVLRTGDAAVHVVGTDRARVEQAAERLVRAPARPSASLTAGDISRPLPPPKRPPVDC